MDPTDEHPEKYGWWINELESLGIIVAKKYNDLNNNTKEKLKDITTNRKNMMYKNYENAYRKLTNKVDT